MRRSLLRALAGFAIACLPGVAWSGDWDHDANIDAGVRELVSTYRLAGSHGMVRLVGGCYEDIDAKPDTDDRLKQLEYCAGMDLAAARLGRIDDRVGAVQEGYFAMDKVAVRVARLSEFLTDPNVGNQIIRAWAIASGDALGREGY